MKYNWRRWFRAFHRDIGYVAVALTIAYGISGIAVNHFDDWNPSYKLEARSVDVGPLSGSIADNAATIIRVLALDPGAVRGHFQETETTLRVFLAEGQEASVDVRTGRGTLKILRQRPLLFQVNALHLNNLKGVWTYVADAFALALIILAITGVSMMKGDRGFWGRGKYFVAAGLAIPIAGIAYLYA